MSLLDVLLDYRWPLLAGIVALHVLRKLLLFYRLRNFRGPWVTAVTGIPHSINTFTGEAHNWYRAISDRYGPIARIGPNALITSSPDVWAHVNTRAGYQRTKWYFEAMRVEHERDHVFSQINTKLHDERRKEIAPGYSGRENLVLEPTIDTLVTDLLTLIRTKYLSHRSSNSTITPMDLSKKIQYFTLDVISAIGTGRAFGMLRADADIDHYIRSSEQGIRLGAVVTGLRLGWLRSVPLLGAFLAPSATDKYGFGAMMGACFGVVEERVREFYASSGDGKEGEKGEGGGGKRRDMLASFIRHKLEGDDLRSEVLETLIAGSDTTAGAIRGIMLYVMANKRVFVRLQEEIDEAVREGKVPAEGEGGIIPYAVAKQLPYLQAVIREGLRVWPPVRNLLPKDVPAGGETAMVDGKAVFLPGGVEIGLSALAMHRDKKLYGEDADLFRPERWFEPDQEKLAAMTRVNNLTFGHGRWECLGKNVAQMELNKVLFELFRHFDWAIAHPNKPWEIFNSMGIFVINDMWVQVTAR